MELIHGLMNIFGIDLFKNWGLVLRGKEGWSIYRRRGGRIHSLIMYAYVCSLLHADHLIYRLCMVALCL